MTLGYFASRGLCINCIIEYNFVNCTNQQSTPNDFTKGEISTLFWKNIHILYKANLGLPLPYEGWFPASHIFLEIQLRARGWLRKDEKFHPEEALQCRKPWCSQSPFFFFDMGRLTPPVHNLTPGSWDLMLILKHRITIVVLEMQSPHQQHQYHVDIY